MDWSVKNQKNNSKNLNCRHINIFVVSYIFVLHENCTRKKTYCKVKIITKVLNFIAFNIRYTCTDFFLIITVILTKEIQQSNFFNVNSWFEKHPTCYYISWETQGIDQNDLCTHGPVKPTYITWVSEPCINTMCYKNVVLGFFTLYLKYTKKRWYMRSDSCVIC